MTSKPNWATVVFAWTTLTLSAQPTSSTPQATPPTNLLALVHSAASGETLAYHLTTPEELKVLLGAPRKEYSRRDGDCTVLTLEYPGVEAVFGRLQFESPYTLLEIKAQGTALDIGQDRPVTLRTLKDLAKLDTFWGAAGVSLAGLDLTGQLTRLNQLPFDTRTRWPAADKLPPGFDPARLLEDGKNPGLGVRKLHQQGIDGRSIHIAIIDQPLLREHREYKTRVVEYTEIDVQGVEPQMHGPPVTSIVVGQSCGVAPAASVHYYAVPAWKWWNEHCRPYARTLEQIIALNQELSAAEKVRVVSLSLGAFSQWPDHGLWAKAVQHAESTGILVVTCDPADLRLARLARMLGRDAEAPESYLKQAGLDAPRTLGVPVGNRTTACVAGTEQYVFWREGGMSWAVPYLAGLGALAVQVDAEIQPPAIRELWFQTASKTSAGLVVNPPAFLEAVREAKAKRLAAKAGSTP